MPLPEMTLEPVTTDVVYCRCCGQELKPEPMIKNYPGSSRIITCFNKLCALQGYTFDAAAYPTKDLTNYLRPARKLR